MLCQEEPLPSTSRRTSPSNEAETLRGIGLPMLQNDRQYGLRYGSHGSAKAGSVCNLCLQETDNLLPGAAGVVETTLPHMMTGALFCTPVPQGARGLCRSRISRRRRACSRALLPECDSVVPQLWRASCRWWAPTAGRPPPPRSPEPSLQSCSGCWAKAQSWKAWTLVRSSQVHAPSGAMGPSNNGSNPHGQDLPKVPV